MSTLAALGVPARMVLGDATVPGWVSFDHLLTVVFTSDLILRARHAGWSPTAYGWGWLTVDFLAALPLSTVIALPSLSAFRLLKLVRVVRMMRVWWHGNIAAWNSLRLLYSVYWIALVIHWLTSGWAGLRGVPTGTDALGAYVNALYWCVTTLTSVGYGDIIPENFPETLYAIGVMIIGVGMFGYVVGNIAHVLMNLYPSRARYVETMEKLHAFMEYRKLPAALQRRIRAYYTYAWEQRMGYDEGSIIAGLPPGLAGEVSMYLKRDVIEKVPFFRGANEAFIRDIALAMRPMVYMPGDVVCRAGDPADEMFFIGRGTIEILARDEQHVQATLRDGDFFGEMSLVMGTPRTASVRSAEYCDLYALDKSSFDRIMLRYPEFAEHVRMMVEERAGATKQ